MKAVNEGKFRKLLIKAVYKKIAFLLILSAVVFAAAQVVTSVISNEQTARNNLASLKEVFIILDDTTSDFLLDEQTRAVALQAIENPSDDASLWNYYRRLNNTCPVRSNFILTDTAGNTLTTSFSTEELTDYMDNFIRAVCRNASWISQDEIYKSVYFEGNSYADRMMIKPIFDNSDAIKGYLTLFISGSAWNYYLSDKNCDGVITDLRNNIMYTSTHGLSNSINKFYTTDRKILNVNGQRFWAASETLEDRNVIITSLVYYPQSATLYVTLLFVIVIAAVWYITARAISSAMAEYNAASIEKLLKELRIIRKGDHNHRIKWERDDEFKEVANQTNYMLDTLERLNASNTELLQLNSRIEIKQLTAQMNPHFLYNTLEIIRSLALYDGEKAGKIISLLTEVLRYSAESGRSEVLLEEDIGHLNSYVAIQQYRFGDRLSFSLSYDEECNMCRVPKLFLQPLIENSIKYGYKKKMDLAIDVCGHMEGNMLIFKVKDNGGGMDSAQAEELQSRLLQHDNNSTSIGLRNLSRRIYLRYGSNSGIQISNTEGTGLEVIVRIEQKQEYDHV